MKQKWTIAGEQVDLDISRQGNVITVTTGGQTVHVSGKQAGGGVLHLSVGGKPTRVVTAAADGKRYVQIGATRVTASKVVAGRRRGAANEDGGGLTSPMPGLVLKVLAEEGHQVSKGETLMIIEAMKMEHAIKAPWDGTVTKIHFAEGDMVTPGAPLAEVKALESQSPDA